MSFHEAAITITAINRTTEVFGKIQADASKMTTGLVHGFTGVASSAANMASQLGLMSGVQSQVLASAITLINMLASEQAAQHACALAAWLHNSALIVQIGLMTLGIGVVIAITAALWGMAEANKAAAASAEELKRAMEGPVEGFGGSNIIRAGEEQLYRRGIE